MKGSSAINPRVATEIFCYLSNLSHVMKKMLQNFWSGADN